MTSTLIPSSRPARSDLDLWEGVRILLPGAVLARPDEDSVVLHTWVRIAETLEASAHVLSCYRDGTQHLVLEVLTRVAERTAADACALLPHPDAAAGPSSGAPRPRTALMLAVERTWLRLAAQLLRPGAADVLLLTETLHAHRAALVALRAL